MGLIESMGCWMLGIWSDMSSPEAPVIRLPEEASRHHGTQPVAGDDGHHEAPGATRIG